MNLRQQAAALTEFWSPKVVGQVNDQYLKIAKLKGEFTWHQHDEEDELFIILHGELCMEYEDRKVMLSAGDFHVVPKGTPHNPRCDQECLVALVESVTTAHTGAKVTELTRSIDQQLS